MLAGFYTAMNGIDLRKRHDVVNILEAVFPAANTETSLQTSHQTKFM